MRFRGQVTNVALFLRLCGALCKIEKTCVLQLAPKAVRFVLTTAVSDGMELWAGMGINTLFDNVTIDSLAEDKSITLKIALDSLEKALKSGQAAQRFVAKLKKRDGCPVLSFVAEVQTPYALTVCQDVPVTVLPSSFMRGVAEPTLPNPDVYIFLPQVKVLRNVVEHMKNVADNVTLSANMCGEFSVGVDTNTVAIVTTFSGLQHPDIALNPSAVSSGTSTSTPSSSSESTGSNPTTPMVAVPRDRQARAKVNITKMYRFLQCYLVQPHNVICCIVEGRSVVFHAILDDLYLTYYLPVIIS